MNTNRNVVAPRVHLIKQASYTFEITITSTDLGHLQKLAGVLGLGLTTREHIERFVPHASPGAQLFRDIMRQLALAVWEKE